MSEIEADAEKLERRLTAAEAEKEALTSRYEEQMKTISAETERRIEEFNRKFAALMDRLGEKEDLIVALNTERKDLELTLAKQRKAYLVLKNKYQRLIRPARSPLGKEVVTVQYSRQDGQYRILYKEPQSDSFEPVGREELQTRAGPAKRPLAGQALYQNRHPGTKRFIVQRGLEFHTGYPLPLRLLLPGTRESGDNRGAGVSWGPAF